MNALAVVMERLDLLLRITPAFAALAWKWLQRGPDDKFYGHAVRCYSDLILIGRALGDSEGPWKLSIHDSVIYELLKAFQSRLPKPSRSLWRQYVEKTTKTKDVEFFLLDEYAKKLDEKRLGGRNACLNLDASMQPGDDYRHYLQIIGSKVNLFHDEEMKSAEKLGRFLTRVTRAKDHLLNMIYKDKAPVSTDDWVLEQHPSHKTWKLADEIYTLLQIHWGCNCSQGYWIRPKERWARLHLSRYRNFSSKSPEGQSSSKFEVLLPNCLKSPEIQWKVTTFEIEDIMTTAVTSRRSRPFELVKKDICQRLKISRQSQVDFVAEEADLYHLQNQALADVIDHYTKMESLHQLLGDEEESSELEHHSPKERIILCYILANALLFLFPGPWLSTAWDSTKLYFNRHPRSPNVSTLAFPYLSTDIQKSGTSSADLPIHQLHYHPAVLGLGIMFLEIASGNRFTHAAEKEPCERINRDCLLARKRLKEYEKSCELDKSKQLFRSFPAIISSCLKLEAPSDLPTNQLWEVEPIRYYILRCVVRPLALELREGYKISLERLHENIGGAPNLERIDELGVQRQHSIDQQPPNQRVVTTPFETSTRRSICRPSSKEVDEETCLFSDTLKGEMPLDSWRVKAARDWIENHECTLQRIDTMRKRNMPNVNIAILDSGIQLSNMNQDIYNSFDPRFVYQDFVDDDAEWRDDIGHGTHLAAVLRKIAPYARIHVARVFKKKPTSDDVDNISKALFHAVDVWKVDIIVMSFGFGERHNPIFEAIKHAHSNGVLLFAAACNDGNNHPSGVAWPANEPRVICVHSGDGLGNKSPYTPESRDNMRIMVLGECIKSAWPEKFSLPENHKYMSGTSCAAPIAAGIAAVLLDYSRGVLSSEEWETFHESDKMRKMFRRLTDDSRAPGYWWIKLSIMFKRDRTDGWIAEEIRDALRC